MKLKNNYVLKQIDNETIAVHVENGIADLRRAVSLNGSAQIIFEALKSGASKGELVQLLTQTYNTPKEEAKVDVEAFLQLLYNNNLLDG